VLFERVKSRALAAVLREAVQRMNESGDEAEARYQQALAAVRQAGSDAIDAVVGEFRATDDGDVVNRWALVQLLSDLQDPRSIDVLGRIVGLPLPEDRSPDPHGSVAARELVVRTTAVEGIARLAAAGSTAAQDALLENVSHPVRSVRIAAILACVEQGGEKARQELQSRVAESERWLLDIRRVHPREIPPIQGHRYLPPKSPPEMAVVPRPSSPRQDAHGPAQAAPPSQAETSRPRRLTTGPQSKRPRARKQRKG
jgi:hypothetical protein